MSKRIIALKRISNDMKELDREMSIGRNRNCFNRQRPNEIRGEYRTHVRPL